MNIDYQNILIAVSGLTPQIITETLYALIVQKQIPIHQVHVITTRVGKERIENLLLYGGEKKLYRFCEEYALRAEDYIPTIHVIEEEENPLDDIRSDRDNQIAADKIINVVQQLTEDPNTRIFASVAGGRKTMGVYMGFAMELFGRKQDRLTHVLVQPESVESNPGFFYIPNQKEPLTLKRRVGDGSFVEFTVPIDQLKIELAEIPFIRLRELSPDARWLKKSSFLEIVEMAQLELEQKQFNAQMEVHLKEAIIEFQTNRSTYHIKLRPMEMAVFYYLASGETIIVKKSMLKSVQEALVKIYENYYKSSIFASSFHYEALQSIRSKINGKIEKEITNPLLSSLVKIQSKRSPQGSIYYLDFPQENIRLIPSISDILS